MRHLTLVTVLLAALSLGVGCGDESDDGTTDSNGATSNGTTATSNGTTATSNGTTATSNGTTATSNGTTATSNGTVVTFADVQPIFEARCSGGSCHSGAGVGGHDIALDDVAVNLPVTNTGACAGTTTKAECMKLRIGNGTMPLGKGCAENPDGPDCLTADEIEEVNAYFDGL